MKSTKLSIFILAALAIAVVTYMYIKEKGAFNTSIILYATVEDPIGLSTNSPVLLNGVKIGKVSDLKIHSSDALIELSIDKEIDIKNETRVFSAPSALLGGNHIEVHHADQGTKKYESGDTINHIVTSKTIKEVLDPNGKTEEKLKEISKSIGAALLDYGNSPSENCNSRQLEFVSKRLEDSPDFLTIKDAHILVENQCRQNVEYSELQNELIFRFLQINPDHLLDILNYNNFSKEIIAEFYERVENPINDGFDLTSIIQQVKSKENSMAQERLLSSLELALKKY